MKCFNLFNSNNPLNNYFFLFFALIFFAIACNRQVNENVESIYEVTKTKNETKPDFELELFKPDTAFEQIGKSLHKNAKSTDEFTKNKTEPDFEIFKPDTTYEQNGKFLSTIISNPYRKVDYIKKGSNGYYKIFFYDINHKMSQEEKLEYVKKIITFNDEFDSLVFLDSHLIGINHKGVKLRNSYVKFTKRYVEVKYINSLYVDVSNIISGKEARNIAINQIKETEDFKFATKEDILKQMEYLRKKNKPIFKSLSYMDTTTTFYIKRYENSYVPVYKFIIYRKTFVIDYVFTINALNGDIIEKKYNGVNSCKQCVNSIVKEADCNTTHPVNILPQVYKTVCNYDPEETY